MREKGTERDKYGLLFVFCSKKDIMSYPLFLPQKEKRDLYGKAILAADIGGTKTSLGLFELRDGVHQV